MINPYYKSVQGWCSFFEFYYEMARIIPENGTFVEVGVWAGRSFIYFLSCLRFFGKKVNCIAVDTWKGTEADGHSKLIENDFGGDIYGHFLDNINKCGFEKDFIALRKNSIEAAESFADNSIDFCFIDADHSYEAVLADIKAWLPKVAIGGIIGGHDYDNKDGVERAVTEIFGSNVSLGDDHTWYIKKEL